MGKYIYDEKGKLIGEIHDKKKDQYKGSWDGFGQFIYFFLIGLPLILIRYAYLNHIKKTPISFNNLFKELSSDIDKKFNN
jgi:hypothetical protein